MMIDGLGPRGIVTSLQQLVHHREHGGPLGAIALAFAAALGAPTSLLALAGRLVDIPTRSCPLVAGACPILAVVTLRDSMLRCK